MPTATRAQLDRQLERGYKELGAMLAQIEANKPIWTPLPGPQTKAYYSDADELFYGGAGGGGKTDLLLGLAGTAHRSSIIFRRIYPSLRGIVERSRQIYNRQHDSALKDSYNESLHVWRLGSGRVVELGAIQHDKDKDNYRGRPHDLYCWDELPEFLESQFRFVNTWNRSTIPGQRCRIVATGNPPTTADGEWVKKYWGPWLDDQWPNPAIPGELRWFASIDGKDTERENGNPFEYKGETIIPRSRTFIPARLEDNPFLEEAGYRSVLQNLPEPLRSQMLYGDFRIGVQDDPYQIIPTEWVRAAIKRWKETKRPDTAMTSLGVDVARGGSDETALAPRYGSWFDLLKRYPGSTTKDGQAVAALVIACAGGRTVVNVDVIGVGSSAYDQLKDKVRAYPVNFGAGTIETDKSLKVKMANIRAACYWKFREALDPVSGQNICLPDDAKLIADLTAPRWELRGGKVYVESKDEIVARIGRSPDSADAVVLSWYQSSPGVLFG